MLPGYFSTLGVPLIEGREFARSDDHEAPGVAVVNSAFVRRFLAGGPAVGTRLDYGDFWQARADPEYEIVGVVSDVRFRGMEVDVPPAIYFPHAQQPVREMALLVRTVGDPVAYLPTLRQTIARLNPTLPVFAAEAMTDKLGDGYAGRRFLATVLGAFAALALTLSGVGLYGVLSFLVAQRRREIGVRIAVGAPPGSVLRLIIRQGMVLVALGLLIGVPATLLMARGLRSFLFEVAPFEWSVHSAAWLTMAAVGLLACALPSVRAARVDPAETLNAD